MRSKTSLSAIGWTLLQWAVWRFKLNIISLLDLCTWTGRFIVHRRLLYNIATPKISRWKHYKRLPSVEWPRPGWLCTPGWTSTWSKPLPPSLLVEAAVLLLVLLLPSSTSAAPAIVAEPCVHLLQQSSAAKNQARMPKKLK